MSERPRDWDRELADIDRLIEKMPAQASGPPPARPLQPGLPAARTAEPARAAPAPAPAPRPARGRVAGTWVLVLLVVALGAALPLWPYVNDCGRHLVGYLAMVGALVIGALWALVLTWRVRSALGHLLALAALLWGLALGAAQVLPRIGYAADAASWSCPAAPADASF